MTCTVTRQTVLEVPESKRPRCWCHCGKETPGENPGYATAQVIDNSALACNTLKSKVDYTYLLFDIQVLYIYRPAAARRSRSRFYASITS